MLKKINPEYSLEGLMLKLKLQYFGYLMCRANSLEKTLMLGQIEGRSVVIRLTKFSVSMVSVCLPSDALLQHLPSYLDFSYLGRADIAKSRTRLSD